MSAARELASLPGQPSRAFGAGAVGRTYPAASWPPADALMDRARFASEGDWAFCRFDSDEVPAVRMGFQAGSFEIGAHERPADPDLLQLHLEVMTAEGGHLWVPTGRFPASTVRSAPERKDVRLAVDGRELLSLRGWPHVEWHQRSDDDELEVRLEVDVRTVTVLPDCLLPHAVFAMWETVCRARGEVRVAGRRHEVAGTVFYDHTRVLAREHDVRPRGSYLYTTLALEDGGGLFGYHAADEDGAPIGYYCFGVLVDPDGRGRFLPDARLDALERDADGLPSRWAFTWAGDEATVAVEVSARPLPLVRGWGGPMAPTSRAGWIIFPLVLDATVRLSFPGTATTLRATGLAEHYDASRWGA